MEFTLLEMTFVVSDLASWVQAIGSIGTFLLGIPTLIALIFYARDTRKLTQTAIKQAEESSVPYLMVEVAETGSANPLLSPTQPFVVNKGRGPAIDVVLTGTEIVTWVHFPGGSQPGNLAPRADRLGDIASGQSVIVPGWAHVSMDRRMPIKFTYTSLYGSRYCSDYVSFEPLRGKLDFKRI